LFLILSKTKIQKDGRNCDRRQEIIDGWMTDQESLERGVYVDSGIKFLKIRFHTTKKAFQKIERLYYFE